MASVLNVLLAFLHKLCSSPNYITRYSRRLALFIAFLGPRFSVWLRSWHRESGTTRQKSTPTIPPSPRTIASSRTVSLGSAGLGENIMACSTAPTSAASVPSLQDPCRGTMQQAIAIPLGGAILLPGVDSLTADHAPCLTSSPDGTTPANLSSADLSVHSSASDRRNIITRSLEPLPTPVGQPSRLARATHPEPGQGQDTSQSIERHSRSSPTEGLCQFTCPDIDTSNISFNTHVDDRNISLTGLAVSPYVTSVVVDIPIGSPPAHYPLPEGCDVRPMNSQEVPRYTKGIKMQANSSILLLHTYTCWQTQRKDVLPNRTVNKNIPLVSLNTNNITGSNRDRLASRISAILTKPRLIKIVVLGYRLHIPTVVSIFSIVRGCVRQ